MGAVKRRFSPEFVNRIDAVVTYQPLGRDSMERILDHQIANLNRHIRERLAEDVFQVELSADARAILLERGTSVEYGARELKRTILRMLTQPLAALLEQKGEHRQGPVTRKTVTARTSHDSTVRSMFLSQFFAQFFPFGVKVTHAGFRISNLPR